MAAYNFPGTLYIESAGVGSSGKASWSTIQTQVNAGWAVCSHAYNHQNLALPLTLTWSGGVVTATVSVS